MNVGAKKDIPRLASNFGRLGINLMMGLVLVPVLFHWLGNDWYGLFQLVFGSVGLALLFEDVSRTSMIRELARAFHSKDSEEFRRVYSTGMCLAVVAALLSTSLFVVLYFLIPHLNIREEMHGPARTLVIAQGITSFATTLLTPTVNMFVVTLRFLADNIWQVIRRAAYVISACVCAFVFRMDDPAEGFRAFVLGANAIALATVIASALQLVIADRRLVPSMRYFDRQTLRNIWPTVMWNTLVNMAMNLYERTSGVIMNLAFGLHGNAVWGPALQLSSYVRMASLGVNGGIEAVSAKVAADHGERSERMQSMIRRAIVLHALVALPMAVLIFGLAGPLVRMWIGDKIDRPDVSIPQIVLLTQILLIPVTARAISDCWSRILYGAGFVSRYAKMVLVGGAINPVLTWGLLKLAPLPEPMRLYVPAAAFALVFTVFHFILLPRITARCINVSVAQIFGPLVRPAIAAALCLAILIAAVRLVPAWNLVTLCVTTGLFGLLFGVVTLAIGVTPSQRKVILAGLAAAAGRTGR